LMIAFWVTTFVCWKLELAGATRLVTWCMGLAGLYLLVMLCVAFVERLEARSKAIPSGPPPLQPPSQDAQKPPQA
jgi:hypothetical protein